jgi:hypothetical protein
MGSRDDRWLHRQATLTAQAARSATTSSLCIAGSENRTRSMNETRAGSPEVCFFSDSYLVYGKRRDSLATRAVANRESAVSRQ